MIRYAMPFENAENAKNTKKCEDLYKEPYFSDRFKIFCDITLKSFANQTSKNFVLLVYQTDVIPKEKKELFDNIEKEYPFVRCIYSTDGEMHIPEDLKKDGELFTFRIDNDDGIATNFIEKLEKTQNDNPDEANFVITIPRIRKVMRVDTDKYVTITFDYLDKTHSMGLAYFSDNGKTVMDLGFHLEIYKKYPTKVISGQGGLQILNGYNLGNKIGNAKVLLSKNDMERLLVKEGYAKLDLGCLPICAKKINSKSASVRKKPQAKKTFSQLLKFHH